MGFADTTLGTCKLKPLVTNAAIADGCCSLWRNAFCFVPLDANFPYLIVLETTPTRRERKSQNTSFPDLVTQSTPHYDRKTKQIAFLPPCVRAFGENIFCYVFE